jgi:ArsR family transcriptional regulator
MGAAGKKGIVGDADRAARVAEVLKAVAHPLRIRVVAALCDKASSVTQLCERLDVRQALLSQHLSVLRLTGLVSVERSNGCATYSIKEEGLRDLVACVTRCGKR